MQAFIDWTTRNPVPLVKKEKENHVINHHYVGDNNSIFYNNCINPFCNIVVEFFPKTLAANSVTMIGFIVNLIPTVLVIYLYGWSLEGELDGWFCYLIGLSYGFYITMDNCDGK